MDNSKPLFLSLLFVLISPAISDNILETIATTGNTNSAANSSLSCAQSLMSCQAYLHRPDTDPPDLCCGPLKTVLANDHKCLCDFFTDGPVLQNMDVPKENAIKLVHTCGSNPDTSSCNVTSTDSTTDPSSSSPYSKYSSGAPMRGPLGLVGSAFTTFIIISSIQWF